MAEAKSLVPKTMDKVATEDEKIVMEKLQDISESLEKDKGLPKRNNKRRRQ